MKKSARNRLIVAISATWVILVIFAYYAVHKPASPEQLGALANLARVGVGWFTSIALANLLGWVVMRGSSAFKSVERLALQIGIGLGLIILALLILGVIGAYWSALLWFLVLLPLPLSLPRLYKDLRKLDRLPQGWLAAFAGIVILIAVVRALSPATAWDSLVYHLEAPRQYVEANRLHHDLDLAYLGFPKAGPMLFLLGLQLAGPELSQVFHWTFMLMTLALTPRLVRTVAPGRAWLAIAILVAVPSAALIGGWAYVEWLAIYFGLASFVLIRATPEVSNQNFDRYLVAAGFCAAMALNSKYTAVWLVLGLSLMVLLRWRSLRRIGAFVLTAAIFAAPMLLINLALTGNPVYPFFLSGLNWDPHRAFWYGRSGTGLGAGALISAPWDATIWGLEGGLFEGQLSYGATVGPLLLALVPLTITRLALDESSRKGSLRDLLIVAGVSYLGWILQLAYSQLLLQSRLLFLALPYFAALASVGFDTIGDLGRWGRSARFVLGGLLAMVLVLTLASMVLETVNGRHLDVVLGSESEEDYLTRQLGFYYLAMEEINSLGAEARVRFLWEPRSFYCDGAAVCEPDALLDRWWHERQHRDHAEEIADQWVESGVTHVLFHKAGAEAVRSEGFDPLDSADWNELEKLLKEYLVPVTRFGEAYTLYAIAD